MSLLPLSSDTIPLLARRLNQALNPFATQPSETSETDDTWLQDRRDDRLRDIATEVLKTHAAFEEYSINPDTSPPPSDCDSDPKAASNAWTKYCKAKDFLSMHMIVDQQEAHQLPTPSNLERYIAKNFGEETELDNTVLQMCHIMSRDPTCCNKTSMIDFTEGKPEYTRLQYIRRLREASGATRSMLLCDRLDCLF